MTGRRLFAVLLLLLAAWTLVLKVAVPVHTAVRDGLPWTAHLRRDGWWVAELALALLLRHPGPFAWGIAVACTAAALLVHSLKVAVLLHGAAQTPPDIHGFVHTCAVLAVFTGLAVWLVAAPEARRLREAA